MENEKDRRTSGVLGLLARFAWNQRSQITENENSTHPATLFRRSKKSRERPPLPLPDASSLINGMMVCLWDNMSGPRAEQVWETAPHDSEMLRYICCYVLGGEIANKCNEGEEDTTEYYPTPHEMKFHLLPQYGFLVTAVVFSGKFYDRADMSDSRTKWAICAFIKMEFLQRYLLIHTVVQEQLSLLATIVQRQLELKPPATAMDLLNDQLKGLLTNLSFLTKSSLSRSECKPTYFDNKTIPPNQRAFLDRALTSYLQTHGSAVVIGDEINAINSMINTLALFLSPTERELCSHAVQGGTYIPDLMIQGVVYEESFDRNQVIRSLLPTTIIDVKQNLIQKTNHHQHGRLLYKSHLLNKLGLGDYTTDSKPPETPSEFEASKELFYVVKEHSPLIHSMLSEILILPPSLREGMILHCRRLLIRKAVILIRHIEGSIKVNKKNTLSTPSLRQIKQNLRLNNADDFSVILAIAEKVSPGINKYVNTGIQQIEERFYNMWVY